MEALEPALSPQAAAQTIAHQIKRALNMYRLYGAAHELTTGAERALLRGVQAATAAYGALRFEVTPAGLTYEGEVVLADESKDDTMTRALLTDGVAAITWCPGVEPGELTTLLGAWFAALTNQLDEEQSFATYVWEQELASVQVEFRADLAESGVTDEGKKARSHHLARVFADLTAARRPRPDSAGVRVEEDALDVIRSVDAFAELTPEALARRANAPRAPLEPLSAVDARALVSGLQAGGRGAGQRTLLGLWRLLRDAEGAEQVALLDLVRSILGTLVTARRPRDIVRALTRLEDRGGSEAPAVLGLLGEPSLLGALVRLLDDDALAEDAVTLLAMLPDRFVRALVPELERSSGATRARLLARIEARRPPAVELAGWILEQGAAGAGALLPLAERLGARHRDLAIRACLVHDAAAVRALGVRAVRTEEVGHHRTLLLEGLEDEDPELRQAVLQSLIRAKEPVAAELLARTVLEEAADERLVRTALSGLAAVGGPRARQVLLQIFASSKVAGHRKASALALASVADEEVVAALEAEERRLLGDRDVKAACREALRRIRGVREAAGDG